MRIISQNGMIDVPYEMAAFHVAEGTIRMNMVGDTGKGTIVAKYSTPEKARKGMEMLHRAYLDCNNNPGGYGYVTKAAYVRNKVFEFPQEDEISDRNN